MIIGERDEISPSPSGSGWPGPAPSPDHNTAGTGTAAADRSRPHLPRLPAPATRSSQIRGHRLGTPGRGPVSGGPERIDQQFVMPEPGDVGEEQVQLAQRVALHP